MTTSTLIRVGPYHYKFQFRMGFFIFVIIGFIAFVLAGIWQFERYHYKKQLLTESETRLASRPVSFMKVVDKDVLEFQPVMTQGYYVNSLPILLQNQLKQGRTGYEVLTPLKISGSKKLLLVDRGWVEKPLKGTLPAILDVPSKQTVRGYIKFVNEFHFILGKNVLAESLPLVMQKIDMQQISRITHAEYYPFVLRLDPAVDHGFTRDWVIVSVIPQRHLAYALQWFLMAAVLVAAYLCVCLERVKKHEPI